MDFREYKTVLVRDLVKYKSNSRTHSKEQIEQIARSITEFGFTNPLLIDENNTIIAGHGRLDAAISSGLEHVPCIVLNGLSETQRAALVIADNRIAMNAGWDMEVLKGEIFMLNEANFDLSLTGFSGDEIAKFLFEEQEGLCDEDECNALPSVAMCQPGEVWLLGTHRLLCGDSTVATDVDLLLDGQLPNTMITDPPYGVKLDMSWRNDAMGGKNNENTIKNDDRADWRDAYVLFPGNVAYVWHANMFTDIVMNNLRDAGFDIRQSIIWKKHHLVLGRSNYHWQHEPCWYAVKKGAKSSWKGDRKQTTVWDCNSPNQSAGEKKDDRTKHPTQKPVDLYVRSIMHHTNEGEYVYDPFAGSGTLMIACEKSGRRALMMELDPKYCDVIIQRYEKFTGQKAIREVTNA